MANILPTLLRETDKVAVWKTSLEPGDALAEFDHKVGYVIVVLAGDHITVQEQGEPSRVMDVFPGEVLVGGPSPFHTVENSGQGDYREIMVELKV